MSAKKKAMKQPKKPVKAVAAPAKKTAGKPDLKSKKLEAKAVEAKGSASEDDEDEEMDRPSSGASSAGVGVAAAAAAASSETSHSFKNFRHHPDMENFYRFIFDSDLRFEALAIIDEVLSQKKLRKKMMQQKARPH